MRRTPFLFSLFLAGAAFFQNPNMRGDATVHWLQGSAPETPTGVSWGVPWADGTVPEGTQMVVKTPDGKALPTQTWPLAYWPDGSVKWTGLAIAADSNMPGPFTVGAGTPPAPTTPVTVTQDAGSVTVSTGPLTCKIAKTGADFIQSLELNGKEVGKDGHLIAVKEDRTDLESQGILREVRYTSAIAKVTVEQSGPVRAVIHIEGKHQSAAGQAWLPFSMRLYFTAGLNSIRMVHSFVYDGDEKKDFIKGLGMEFTVPFREETQNRHVGFATDGDGAWQEPVVMSPGYREVLVKGALAWDQAQLKGERIPNLEEMDPVKRKQIGTVAVWNGFKLSQLTPDSFSVDKRTSPESSWLHIFNGNRAQGLVFAGDVSGGLAVGVKHFWQKYPAQFEVNGAAGPAGDLKVWLWSPDAPAMDLRRYDTVGHDGRISYEDFQEGFGTPYGVGNTAELTLWALPNTPDNAGVPPLAKTSNDTPLLVCSPQYYHDVPVFGAWSLPDRSTPDRAAMEDALNRAWNFYAGEVDRRNWYGFWDYGDFMRTYSTLRHGWMYDIGGHAWNNTELMADAWLWYDFLRTGRADAFHLAEAMTRNTSEVDVYHIGRFAGIGSRHNVSHWGCGAKEVRISEAFLKRFYYYLTTDERTGDLMRGTLTADQNLPNALPLRHQVSRPDVPILIRTGPDWTALASDWMTEYERTRDPKYKDYVLAGMKGIGNNPDAFMNRIAWGLDPKTKALYDVQQPLPKTYEFLVLFGGDQIAYEMMHEFDCPQFVSAWNALMDKWARAAQGPGYTKARITAYAANVEHDPALGKKAWDEIRASVGPDAKVNFPENPTKLKGPEVPEPVDEISHLDTPGTAQWALTLITTMQLAHDYYVPPAPEAKPTPQPRD